MVIKHIAEAKERRGYIIMLEHQQLIVDNGTLLHLVNLLKRHKDGNGARAVYSVIKRAVDAIANLDHENSSIKTCARKRLMKTFREMIDGRRSGVLECREDFLQSMLDRDSYPSNDKLSDSEIMDNLLTLIIAGQSTTAAAMMRCVKFLDENRDVQDRLREEQLSITKNKSDEILLTLEDVKSMPYGLKVVNETLRMSNVLLWFPRVALDDCTIEGYEIKKGWQYGMLTSMQLAFTMTQICTRTLCNSTLPDLMINRSLVVSYLSDMDGGLASE